MSGPQSSKGHTAPPSGITLIFREGRVFTSSGHLIGQISSWQVDTTQTPTQCRIEIMTDIIGAGFLNPMVAAVGAEESYSIESTRHPLGAGGKVRMFPGLSAQSASEETSTQEQKDFSKLTPEEKRAYALDLVEKANQTMQKQFGFGVADDEVVKRARDQGIDRPTYDEKTGMIIEPLNPLHPGRFQPRSPLLLPDNMRPRRVDPPIVEGVSNEQIIEAERMLDEEQDHGRETDDQEK